MELIKEKWDEQDISEFQQTLVALEDPSKREWSKKLLNTELPVLSIKTAVMKDITNQISKGNYLSFLDLMIWEYYENTAVNGMLISKIKHFDTFKKYLDIYSLRADNWATCDLLTFHIKGNEQKYMDLTMEYIKSELPFRRRIGMYILFYFIDDDDYISKIFDLLNCFENEENYYVNMMNGWLFCECFIKQREKTLAYLDSNKLNRFTINKGIQKCRESRRVSPTDKEMLLKYKK
ncbi:MAG: DNA alkylation repair protein [Clostridia bacterium]|nr:DNA alkylation repair protein [Clostridia bacterium]